ncbi:hypothetical protein R3P38DRAFT_2808374 [Favolaschia claudopus]|uniref:Uncharacterized protein n=1 Tax=Favolaschia claudopus TaxID=2862362 RepID=A0AAV9ZG02_9AGAR
MHKAIPKHDVKVSGPTPPTEFTKIQNFFGSFGKETADQAIQQGNARAITGHRVNRRTYSRVQANGQLNNTSRSTIAGNRPGLPTTVPAIFIYFSQRRTQVYKALVNNTSRGKIASHQRSLTLSNTFGVLYPPDHSSSSLACSFDFYKTSPHQANLYCHNYKEHQCLIAGKGVGLQRLQVKQNVSQAVSHSLPWVQARNEAFDRDYKAICLAGKSEGIEQLKQCTDSNIAFERKSVVLIERIWVFSMPCTQGQALQDPHILARVRDIDFRLLESRGICRKTSYLTLESGAGFREKGTQRRGTGPEIDSVGGDSARNCFLPPRGTGIRQRNRNLATRPNCLPHSQEKYKDTPPTKRNEAKAKEFL